MKVCVSNNNQTIKIISFLYIGLVQMACSLFLSNSLSPYSSREEAEHVQKLRTTSDDGKKPR